jgi:hypothetical protein
MADEIVAVYRAEVDQYKKAVDDLTSKVNALDKAQNKVGDDAQADFGKGAKAVGGMSASVTSLTTQMKSLAAAVGIAFTLDRVVAFARESVKLAASAEGVERAFSRVGSPQLLDGLRKATRGTVSDLQLMQNAVKASNFQIPLEQLANMFKFAQSRARETGESVDVLVDSIILGIGRKSPLILDNLGISAVRLREKFNGLSVESASVTDVARVFGEIATEELAKVGNQADTTADKLAQLSVAWDKISMAAGKGLVNLGTGFAYLLGLLDDADPRMTGFLKALEGIRSDRVKDLASGYRDLTDIYVEVEQQLKKVFGLEEELSKLGTNKRDRERRKELITFLIPAEKARLDMLREVFEEEKKRRDAGPTVAKEEIRNVFFLTNAIKALKDEREKEGTSVARIYEIKKLLPPLEEELKRLLEDENVKVKELTRSLNDLAAAFEETMNAQMGVINAYYDEQSILATREIASQEERAQVLKEIERARLMEQIQLLQAYGQAATSERLKLAQTEAGLLDEADENYKKFLAGNEADHKAMLERREKAERDSAEREKEARKQAQQDFEVFAQANIDIINAISQVQARAIEYEMNLLDTQLEQGQISREQYDARRRSLLKQQAEQNKALALMSAVIGTAVAVTQALAVGPPQGYILAAISAALGAVQIGLIASEPIPQFAKGVIGLNGAGTETSDSIHARLSKGESVITAAETRKYRPILEGIRRGTLDEIIRDNYVRPAIDAALLNGFGDMGTSAMLQDRFNDMNILRALDRHGFAEVGELREMNLLLKRHLKVPKRGYA